MSRSRRRLNARRLLASVGLLPSVMIGSATRRNSFAFGSVVLIASCFRSETVMLRSIARRWLLVRLSLRSPWRGRMFVSLFCQTCDPAVFEVHAQRGGLRGGH